MRRGQVFILTLMALMVILLFGAIAVTGYTLVGEEPSDSIVEVAEAAVVAAVATDTPGPTNTPTAIPSNTPTGAPTGELAPTKTATMVVNETATRTPTKTPIPTKTATATITPVRVNRRASTAGSRNSGNASFVPQASATPASRFPYRIASGPTEYDTENTFFVVLANVTHNGWPQGNYRLIGFHSTLDLNWESAPSCDHICKASAPVGVHDDDGNLVQAFARQEGNLTFEFPHYEDGTLTLVLVNHEGSQVAEPIQITLNKADGERRWYFVHYNQ